MEMVLQNGFCELEQNEMLEVDGGDIATVIGNAVIGFVTGVGGWDLQNAYIIGKIDGLIKLKELEED